MFSTQAFKIYLFHNTLHPFEKMTFDKSWDNLFESEEDRFENYSSIYSLLNARKVKNPTEVWKDTYRKFGVPS